MKAANSTKIGHMIRLRAFQNSCKSPRTTLEKTGCSPLNVIVSTKRGIGSSLGLGQYSWVPASVYLKLGVAETGLPGLWVPVEPSELLSSE